jgi:hypothetical protein
MLPGKAARWQTTIRSHFSAHESYAQSLTICIIAHVFRLKSKWANRSILQPFVALGAPYILLMQL